MNANDNKIYSCHNHTFTNNSVPNNFIPFITRLLAKSKVSRWLGRFVNKITPWSNNDIFDRFMTFLNIGNKDQLSIFQMMMGYYPAGTVFIDLPMDMAYMGAGKVRKNYTVQLEELAQIKTAYPDTFMPFVMVDPRRPMIKEILIDCVEIAGFSGIKLYPALGYYPWDERLDPIYEYAQKKNLPVMSHCGINGAVHARGKIDDLLTLEDRMRNKYKKKWNNFGEPTQYIKVLSKFPQLRICLAHMGGTSEMERYLNPTSDYNKDTWYNDIREMIRTFPNNIFADVSYTMANDRLLRVLDILLDEKPFKNNVLYGSDYYMTVQEESEREFSMGLRSAIGLEKFRMISNTNARRFLGIK